MIYADAQNKNTYTVLVPLSEDRTEITLSGGVAKDYFFLDLFNLVFSIAAFLSVTYLAVIGLNMVIANINGKVFEQEELKNRLYDIVFGIILLLFSYIILNTINPALLNVDASFNNYIQKEPLSLDH